jgi:mono/diheme cytochrome c family protein
MLAMGFLYSAGAALAQDHENPRTPGQSDLGATTEAFTDTDGETLYRRACSGCHGPGGGGAYGAGQYPALAGNARLSSARYPVHLIIEGNGAMPSFGEWLTNGQIAAITTYIRSNMGNDHAGAVTAEDVARMRADFADSDGG